MKIINDTIRMLIMEHTTVRIIRSPEVKIAYKVEYMTRDTISSSRVIAAKMRYNFPKP